MIMNRKDVREIYIPKLDQHEGKPENFFKIKVLWECVICGRPRGEIKRGSSYDGSRRWECDTWENACGHREDYAMVRAHALNLVKVKARRLSPYWELSIRGEPVGRIREFANAEQQIRDYLKTVNPKLNVDELVILIKVVYSQLDKAHT